MVDQVDRREQPVALLAVMAHAALLVKAVLVVITVPIRVLKTKVALSTQT